MNTGKWGEKCALKYLRDGGAIILASNFRCKAGEIDIIAVEGGAFAFIEVKTRSCLAFGLPCEAVGRRKRERITRAARLYLILENINDAALRFDVIEVLIIGGKTWIRHIRNAF